MKRDRRSCTSAARASGSTTSPAGCSTPGEIQRYIDELLGDRADLEPVDLRQGDRVRRLRRRDPREGRQGTRRSEDAVLRAGDRGSPARRRPVPAHPRAHRRRRRLGVARGVAAAGLRHRRARSKPRRPCTRAGRATQPVHQDPRHRRGPAGDHRMHRRRCPGERDAAVLRRPVPAAADAYLTASSAGSTRASTRPWARSRRCSCRDGTWRSPATVPDAAAGPARRSRSASTPTGPTATSWTPTGCSGWRTRAPGCSGCCGRARGPRTRPHPTRSTCTGSRRRSRSTPCPTGRWRPSTTTARSAPDARRRRRRRRGPRPFADAGVDVDALAESAAT